MEFQIRNSYIKKFLDGFAGQNQLKVIKYLTILGINQLETSKNTGISFLDLKKMAKNITKNCSKEQKHLNKELTIIKTELAKLNQKFEEKLKSGPETPSPNKKSNDEMICRSASVPRNYDARMLTKKPPSRWRTGQGIKSQEIIPDPQQNTRRASSIEPSALKHGDNITPKPNEITFPRVDPRENANYVTRHHLDDSEAKRTLKEEGVIYFPGQQASPFREKDQNRTADRSVSNSKSQRETQGPYQYQTGTFAVRKLSDDDNYRRQSLTNEPSPMEYKEFTKSPKFAQTKENVPTRVKASPAKDMRPERDTETSHRFPIPRPQNQKSKGAGLKSSNHDNQKSAQAKKVKQKILRDKAMNVGRGSRSSMNQTHFERPSTGEFNHVESKIRDEVKYHKELSRQYKKMKQSIQDYTDHGTEKFSNASSSMRDQNRDKFMLVEKDEERGYVGQYPFEQSRHQGYTHPSGMGDLSSSQRSMYLKESSSQYSNKSPSYSISLARSRRSEMPPNNNDLSQSKYSAARGGGGMLDIANSFLNSPFMQHLSNLDAKESQRSSEASSINPSASASMRRRYDEEHGETYEPKRQTNFRRSPNLEEDSRMRETNQNYSKHSEQVPYRSQRAVRRENSSMLKDSGNQRYADYIGKEAASSKYQKNEGTSFASSNFSNFLNDEMKGFFQKETLDLKRPKHSRSVVRSSANSSHISFNANEFSTNSRDPGHGHSRGNSYSNPQDHTKYNLTNNKSYMGDLADTSNVFKQERMSVTQLLNTTS